jgi:hypothetical protein
VTEIKPSQIIINTPKSCDGRHLLPTDSLLNYLTILSELQRLFSVKIRGASWRALPVRDPLRPVTDITEHNPSIVSEIFLNFFWPIYFKFFFRGGGILSELILSIPESQSYFATECQSTSLNKAPIWGFRPDFYYCQTVPGLLMWSALSDDRTGLSFTTPAGPRQCIHSQVRVPWDSWPYFTVSDSRLPFSSPPTTRRTTVNVFDPLSIFIKFLLHFGGKYLTTLQYRERLASDSRMMDEWWLANNLQGNRIDSQGGMPLFAWGTKETHKGPQSGQPVSRRRLEPNTSWT